MASDEKILVRNEVDKGKAKDFEKLLTEKVVPAVERARKDLSKRWDPYRGDDEDDKAVFFFLFDGNNIDDWELAPILNDALGEADAEEVLKQFTSMLLDEQTVTPLRPLG